MLTAASVMISASWWPGTSMTKQWLIRRAVRMPVSRATTAPISSSVCRLPFISASALPSRTSSTAFAAESWLCADSLDRKLRNVELPPAVQRRGCGQADRPACGRAAPA